MTKLEQLICDLNDALELIEGYVDIRDSSDGPLPNDAMRAAALIEQAISTLQKEQLKVT